MDHIYDDLEVYPDIDVEFKKLQQVNTELNGHIGKLEGEITRLNNELVLMKNVQQTLEKNISSLFITARSEIERKDKRNVELQKELYDLQLCNRSNHTGLSSRGISPRNSKDRQFNKVDNDKGGMRTYGYGSLNRKTPPRNRSANRRHSLNRSKSKSPVSRTGTDHKSKFYDKGRHRDRNQEMDPDGYKTLKSKRSKFDDRRSPTNKRGKYEPEKFDAKNDRNKRYDQFKDKQHGKSFEHDNVKQNSASEKNMDSCSKVLVHNSETRNWNNSYEEGEIVEEDNMVCVKAGGSQKKDRNQKHGKEKNDSSKISASILENALKGKQQELKSSRIATNAKPKESTPEKTNSTSIFQNEPEEVAAPKLVTSFKGCITRDKPNDLILTPNSSLSTMHDKLANNNISSNFLEAVKKHDRNSNIKCAETERQPKHTVKHEDINRSNSKSNNTSASTMGLLNAAIVNLNHPSIVTPVGTSGQESSEFMAFGISNISTITTSDDKDSAMITSYESEVINPTENVTNNVSHSGNVLRGKPRPRRRGGVVKMID